MWWEYIKICCIDAGGKQNRESVLVTRNLGGQRHDKKMKRLILVNGSVEG